MARIKEGCDCGCNDPVAKTALSMLKFLANRLEYAGVSDVVAKIYAHDIRLLLTPIDTAKTPFEKGYAVWTMGLGISDLLSAVNHDSELEEAQRGYMRAKFDSESV